jgi:pumilio homology domain family member 6
VLTVSKKDIALRREELLDVVSETFLDIVSELADNLMRDPLESQVVQEILLHARGDKLEAIQAVADLAARHPSNANHIIKLPFTGRIFKTLVQGGHYNNKEKKVDGNLSHVITDNSC